MSSVVTLAQLRAQVLDRADMTDSEFPVSARVTDYINAELGELYALLVTVFEDMFITRDVSSVALVSGTESYNLPATLYKLLRVFYTETNGTRHALRRFSMGDLDRPVWSELSCDNRFLQYRMLGSKIYFSPKPTSSGIIELFYVPEMTKLAGESDVISFAIPVTWEDVVVCGAAARLLQREESDPTPLWQQKAFHVKRLKACALDRDLGEPARMRLVRGRHYNW